MENQIRAYQTAETMGKSQVELILMVYDGALKAVDQATHLYTEKKNDKGYEQVQKIKRFVTHLYSTLDSQKGGEVAENLSRMYVYILTQCYVIEANQNTELLDSVGRVLGNLRSAWAELRDQQSNLPPTETVTKNDVPANLEKFVTLA